MPTITDEVLARKIWEDTKAQAIGQAEIMGHVSGHKKLTPDEQLLMWLTEADGWSVEKELALLASGKSREQVGDLKYPHRMALMTAGPRFLNKYEQAKYGAQMAQKADPTWQPTPPPGSQPPAPSPLPTPTPIPEAPPETAGPPAYPLTPGG